MFRESVYKTFKNIPDTLFFFNLNKLGYSRKDYQKFIKKRNHIKSDPKTRSVNIITETKNISLLKKVKRELLDYAKNQNIDLT